jgi:hypothetical protein
MLNMPKNDTKIHKMPPGSLFVVKMWSEIALFGDLMFPPPQKPVETPDMPRA